MILDSLCIQIPSLFLPWYVNLVGCPHIWLFCVKNDVATSQSINQSVNQSINLSVNQSINQSNPVYGISILIIQRYLATSPWYHGYIQLCCDIKSYIYLWYYTTNILKAYTVMSLFEAPSAKTLFEGASIPCHSAHHDGAYRVLLTYDSLTSPNK